MNPDPSDPPFGDTIDPAALKSAGGSLPTVTHVPETRPGTQADGPDMPAAYPYVPGYEIQDILGRGGMGVVYRAVQTALKRIVALKMIRSGDGVNPEELARFKTEAEAVARLGHPNVVQIYEVGEFAGQPYFSLEFIDGGTLQARLNGTPIPPRQAAILAETLAQAMDHVHRSGVLHRDLKPANVLLTRSPVTPKITDFGLAKHLDAGDKQTQTGQVMGTPSYMAPEQARGRTHEIGPGADIYALGAILYEMLTGRPPFKGATLVETLEQVCTAEPVPPRSLQPGVPRDLETVCLKCLEKERTRRYSTSGALADDLRRFLDGKPIAARPIGPAGRLWRWCKRRPLPASLIGAAAALLLTVTLYTMTRPAYLDLRVTPAEAAVTLDGDPVVLSDGQALVSWRPGSYRLEVTAEGYLPQEQKVNLVRGRGNAVVAGVELRSAFGDLEVNSDPPGAAVQVLDPSGKVFDEGQALFRSKRLLGGGYRLRVRKDYYHESEVAVTVPTGNERTALPPVKLRLVDGGTDALQLVGLLRKLDEPWKGEKVIPVDPQVKLSYLLGVVARKENLTMVINTAAFEAEGVREAAHMSIVAEKPLSFVDGEKAVTLGEVLTRALDRIMTPSGAAVEPRRLPGGEYALEVTTDQFAERSRLTILHAVSDLVSGPNAMSSEELLAVLGEQLLPAETAAAGLRFLPTGGGLIHVNHNWRVQRAVDQFLSRLRQARRAGGNAPPPKKGTGMPREEDDRKLAMTCIARGDRRGAIGHLKRLVERSPGDEGAWTLLMQSQWALGQMEEAVKTATQVLNRDPSNFVFRSYRMAALVSLKRYAEAGEDAAALAWQNAAIPGSAFNACATLALAGKTAELRSLSERMLKAELKYDVQRSNYLAARICTLAPSLLKDYTPALKLLQAAEKHTPRGPYLHTLGMIHLRAGQLDDAEKRLLEGAGAGPGPAGKPHCWLGLALVSQQRGNTAKAKQWLAKATDYLTGAEWRAATQNHEEFSALTVLRYEAETLLQR